MIQWPSYVIFMIDGKVLANQQIPLKVGPQSMAMMMLHHDMMEPGMMGSVMRPGGW